MTASTCTSKASPSVIPAAVPDAHTPHHPHRHNPPSPATAPRHSLRCPRPPADLHPFPTRRSSDLGIQRTGRRRWQPDPALHRVVHVDQQRHPRIQHRHRLTHHREQDQKSTRLNSRHRRNSHDRFYLHIKSIPVGDPRRSSRCTHTTPSPSAQPALPRHRSPPFSPLSPPPRRSTPFPYTTLFRSWHSTHRSTTVAARSCSTPRRARRPTAAPPDPTPAPAHPSP